MDTFQVIVLAAGHGSRMKSEVPKVLIPLGDKPLVGHLLDSIKESRVCSKPALVVGHQADQVQSALGDHYTYIFQEERLGTAHAVACAKPEFVDKAKHIMVLYGDHPFVSAGTIRRLAKTHLESGKMLTMATVQVPDFEGWRKSFYDFGRVVRHPSGLIKKIVEKKDASEHELAIKEVNPAYFCFRASWLWEKLPLIRNQNNQKEYYLTDLAALACKDDHLTTLEIEPHEGLGVNTQEHLASLELAISEIWTRSIDK